MIHWRIIARLPQALPVSISAGRNDNGQATQVPGR
jgi:hypothetical protein